MCHSFSAPRGDPAKWVLSAMPFQLVSVSARNQIQDDLRSAHHCFAFAAVTIL